MSTATTNRKDIAWILLFSGAHVDAKNVFGHTALMVAAWHGKNRVINALLSAGANVLSIDYNGWTVLMHASDHPGRNRSSHVRTLLANGGSKDVNRAVDGNCSPLMIAALRCNIGVVYHLLLAGADPFMVRKGHTVRQIIAAAQSPRLWRVWRQLVPSAKRSGAPRVGQIPSDDVRHVVHYCCTLLL